MQDPYAADIGDFGKYGLLRWVCGLDQSTRRFALAVNWYLYHERTKNNDGRFVDYLDGASPVNRNLIRCDPVLADEMRAIIQRGRSVASVEQSTALQEGTLYHSEPLSFEDVSVRERLAHRQAWLAGAFERLSGGEIVFFDPDNGLEVKSVPRTRSKGPKYVFCDELLPYWERGQSLVVYQHLAQGSKHERQISDRLNQLKSCLRNGVPIALHYHRGTSRVFFVIPNPAKPDVVQLLRNRIDDFTDSPWVRGGHFSRMDC